MKKYVYLLTSVLVISFYWGCEPESTDFVPVAAPTDDEVPDLIGDSVVDPTDDSQVNRYYNWKMVVHTVDNFEGDPSNTAFINVLLGNTLSNGISTYNTTYFKLHPSNQMLELQLLHMGWTLWEAYGFYPIEWKFKYLKTESTFQLEGIANLGLSFCEIPEGANLVNRFYFSGNVDETNPNKFIGTYVWSETYETGTCVKISGKMEVLKEYE